MGEEEAARREWEEELGPGERWAPEAWEEEEERRVREEERRAWEGVERGKDREAFGDG